MSKPAQYALVFFQILFIVLVLVSGPEGYSNPLLESLEMAGFLLVVWSLVYIKQHSKFRGIAEPAREAKLLTGGPYRYIRHPLYTGILLVLSVITIEHYTTLRLTFLFLEAAVLIIKISLEEKFLARKFSGYKAYKSRTRRLVPFVY